MSSISLLSVFVLACFVGYYVVWRVTPALHAPLMAVTNAISSVIIVGGLTAASVGVGELPGFFPNFFPGLFSDSTSSGALASPDAKALTARYFGLGAVFLASINIVGGFVVTYRMLHLFRQGGKRRQTPSPHDA